MNECDVEDDGCFWIANISEMETLLWLVKNNRDLFNDIVQEKLNRHKNKSKEGYALGTLYRERKIMNNHIHQQKFENFNEIPLDIIQNHLRS